MRKLILAGVLCLISGAALAQQVGAPAPAKDAKDIQIEILAAQRNEAMSGVALCYGTQIVEINNLKGQLAQANAALAASQKALKDAQPPVAAAPAPTPEAK